MKPRSMLNSQRQIIKMIASTVIYVHLLRQIIPIINKILINIYTMANSEVYIEANV